MLSGTVKPAPLKRLPHRALGLAMLLGLLPAVALAAPPQGEWQGVIHQANNDVAVDVSFNAQGARLHFSEPFACAVPAKFLKINGTATVYRFAVSTNGGRFCDGLTGQNLTLTPASNAQLKVAFEAGGKTWGGELSSRTH